MVRVWLLADPYADPGIFAKAVQARLPENNSDNVFFSFCPQLLQFYSGLSMFFFKENSYLTRFRGWGGGVQHFPGESNLFQEVKPFPGGGGGWGSKC